MMILFIICLFFWGYLTAYFLVSHKPKLTANQRILASAARLRAEREAREAGEVSE